MLGKISALLAALVVPALVVAAPAHAATGDVSGTVTSYGSPMVGVPVKAYSVVADDGEGQVLLDETVTDGSGHYTLQPGASKAILCFESPFRVHECWQDRLQSEGDPSRYGTPVNVQAAGGVTGIDASLIVGGSISGELYVQYPHTVAGPVAGNINATSDEHFFFTTSGEDGKYAFEHLPPGSYRVCAWGTDLLQICERREVADGSSFNDAHFGFDARPQVFAATAGGVDRVTWSWVAVPGATAYRIAISTSPTMSKARVRYVEGRFATFTGLTRRTTYYASVRAMNLFQMTAPTPVFKARPGWVVGLRLWDTSSTSLIVRSGTYVGAAKYQFRISSTSTFAGYRTLTASEPLAHFDLRPDTRYYFQVRALTKSGTALTGWSATVSAKTWPPLG